MEIINSPMGNNTVLFNRYAILTPYLFTLGNTFRQQLQISLLLYGKELII